jgi:hypothetical protein
MERVERLIRSTCMETWKRALKIPTRGNDPLAGTESLAYAFAPGAERRLMVDKDERGGGRAQASGAGGGGRHAGGEVDPRVQNEIGRHLRAIYDDVISEPVPERFMELLKQLEKSAGKRR